MKLRCYVVMLYILSVLPEIKNQVLLDLQLFDFINSQSMTQSKKKCDPHTMCDTFFEICVSDNNPSGMMNYKSGCNILKNKTIVFNNQNNIAHVFNSRISLKKIPMNFYINVSVKDYDYLSSHDQINSFIANSTPILNKLHLGFLTPKIFIKDVQFQYKYKFICDTGFYGDNCEPHCAENSIIYSCLLKQCNSKCVNGRCVVNEANSSYWCNCSIGWQGKGCSMQILDCDNTFCSSDGILCGDQYCFCNLTSSNKLLCKKKLDSRRITSNFLEKSTIFYVITGIPLCVALFGVVAFIAVTIWRHHYFIPKVSSPLFQNEDYNFDEIAVYKIKENENNDESENDIKL